MQTIHCPICDFSISNPPDGQCGTVEGNTARFRADIFHLWRCPNCLTVYNIDPADLSDLYRDYPRFAETLDGFAKATLGNLIKRLEAAGLKKTDSILYVNFGNNQVFLDLMQRKGYVNVEGYNPYLARFSRKPVQTFDYVVANDSIEHTENVREALEEYVSWMKPNGTLYIGTPDASVIASMDRLGTYRTALHQPFHRVIITETTLKSLSGKLGMNIVAAYRRSYLDTLIPFANRRFLEELSRVLGDSLDNLYDMRLVVGALMRHPRVLFYGFFGYFFPSAYEPAVILRR